MLCVVGNLEPSGSRKLPKPGRLEEEGKENKGGIRRNEVSKILPSLSLAELRAETWHVQSSVFAVSHTEHGVFTVQGLQYRVIPSGRCGSGSAGVLLSPETSSADSRCCDCVLFSNLSFKVSKPRRRIENSALKHSLADLPVCHKDFSQHLVPGFLVRALQSGQEFPVQKCFHINI